MVFVKELSELLDGHRDLLSCAFVGQKSAEVARSKRIMDAPDAFELRRTFYVQFRATA